MEIHSPPSMGSRGSFILLLINSNKLLILLPITESIANPVSDTLGLGLFALREEIS